MKPSEPIRITHKASVVESALVAVRSRLSTGVAALIAAWRCVLTSRLQVGDVALAVRLARWWWRVRQSAAVRQGPGSWLHSWLHARVSCSPPWSSPAFCIGADAPPFPGFILSHRPACPDRRAGRPDDGLAIVRSTVYNVGMGTRAMQEATFLILTALADGSQHGYGILTDVQELSGGQVRLRPSTLYTALDRLRADELIGVDREEVVDGRLRRYYRLTPEGTKRLAAEAARLQAHATAALTRLDLAGGMAT